MYEVSSSGSRKGLGFLFRASPFFRGSGFGPRRRNASDDGSDSAAPPGGGFKSA